MALTPERLAELRAKAAAIAGVPQSALPQPQQLQRQSDKAVDIKQELIAERGQDMLVETASDGKPEITLLEYESSEKSKAPAVATATPLSNADQIINRIEDLRLALQHNMPNYEMLLHSIHLALHKDEDVVHVLTEEQIGIICAGLSKKKGIVLATTAAKTKTSGGKKLSAVTLDDI